MNILARRQAVSSGTFSPRQTWMGEPVSKGMAYGDSMRPAPSTCVQEEAISSVDQPITIRTDGRSRPGPQK